ncbi:MAG TPA: spore germination protein [Pseudobacteroides sp.]|uniref:spore germination protein n=1 Tax=Pseudobacteroides sp. TaxID=1968840 RepID=UPI002F95636E
MTGIFNTMMGFLTYKPNDKRDFELLEGKYEGVERTNIPEAADIKTDSQAYEDIKTKEDTKKHQKSTKTPLSIDEWNKQKNEESTSFVQTEEGKVSFDLNSNMEFIKQEFGIPYNTDIMIRQFKAAQKFSAFIVYIDGMVDKNYISNFLIRPLMDSHNFHGYLENDTNSDILDYIEQNVISAHEIASANDWKTINYNILSGNTALFVENSQKCLVMSTRGYEKRSVGKPITENVVMGSQEAFTENLRTNLSLVRKIIKNKNLITEMIKVGNTNQAHVGIMYLNGIVNQEVVKEVKRRINDIDAAFVMGDGMVEQFIEENPFMILPQGLTTERPDRVASFITEGKVAIISEGVPFALVVPITFFHMLQTSEDSMLRWQYGTFLRFIRIFGLLVATFLPAMYVALTLFHQEMVPTELLASIAKSKEEVPFPTVAEILLLEISFELIREGGIRIPGVIGQTLGIIGALILGQAAVAAGLVSPILIIIVAVTGLGSFAIPNYSFGIGLRIIRFLFIFFASILGFYGISLGLFLLSCILCSMKSFGVPYFSPVAPKSRSNPDLIIRHPIRKQNERPDYLNVPNRKKAR